MIISSQNIPKKVGHHQDSIKPRFPKCESCNEYFSDYHKLNQHLDVVHKKTENFDTENINDDDEDNGSELKLDPKDSLKSLKIEENGNVKEHNELKHGKKVYFGRTMHHPLASNQRLKSMFFIFCQMDT